MKATNGNIWSQVAMHTILESIHKAPPERAAIGAPDRAPLSYAKLATLADTTRRSLRTRGIATFDRVAIVLANGPEMATAFLTCASAASTAPLNPAYTAREYEIYLDDLKPKALLVAQDDPTPARTAAAALGIPLIEITHNPSAPAGWFEFVAHDKASAILPARPEGPTRPNDEALVLHTSGTTSKPKLVALTQKNLMTSAQNVASRLHLTSNDVGLNIMPLFHIHGIIGSLLASISAGARIDCTPGFNALKVYAWLAQSRPTWYTAVPTMHQIIASRAPRNRDTIDALNLRLVRSSSAALAPTVMADLEQAFKAPVIEAYGMTEAAHQIASNELPPATRNPGTVGTKAGPDIAIMNEYGTHLPAGTLGEIVIRGDNVFNGYLGNDKATRAAFHGNWFRTGDQGMLDDNGALTITGRLKELINRGGEKIAPREVDEALGAHPAVREVVTFAIPHDKLGEDIAALIVLKDDATANATEIRAFAANSLADFKLPRKILFRKELPKGATGKLQRIGLAEKLGLTK